MASLSSTAKLGNASASSLIKSSQSIQSSISSYEDGLASYTYDLSSKTDGDLAQYQGYLQGRIDSLNSTGNVTDANKALSLARTLTTATRSNVSANIARENIDVMSGNGSLQDKYDTIVGQFQRATAIGDMSLAQQLEGQAYSVSQNIQYQAQQAQQAGAALASANASAEGNVVTYLSDSLKDLTNTVKNVGQNGLNSVSKAWIDSKTPALQAMGVIIPKGAQPNYWDLVQGIANAQYNALTLQAQLQSVTNPGEAQNTAYKAYLLSSGATKIDNTLGGSLSIQEINQAAQDPSMFAYNNSSGKYERTVQAGYQYIDSTDIQGNTTKVLAPSYTGIVVGKGKNLADVQASGALNGASVQTMFFLNPNQTAELHGLGLNFGVNKNGSTGDGVQVQATSNTPTWLKAVIGKNGLANAFTDSAGNLQFQGASTSGQGMSYYSLINVGGLSGIFEHFADGSSKLAGGNYGFDAGAAQLLVNMGQQKQQQIQLQTKAALAAQQASLKISPAPQIPQVTVHAPQTSQVPTKTASPQTASVSPQNASPASTSILQPAAQHTSNVQGVPLIRQTLPGVKL